MYKSANWAYIYVDRIYKLYELEYKLSQLNHKKKTQGGFLYNDDEELYRVKIEKELYQIASKLLNDFIEVFGGVADSYPNFDMPDQKDRAKKNLQLLKSAKQGDKLEEIIIALNTVINEIHSGGSIIGTSLTPEDKREHRWDEGIWIMDHGALDDLATKGFLSSLTRGDFVEQWDKEIEKKANKINWYKKAFLPSDDEMFDRLDSQKETDFHQWVKEEYDSSSQYNLAEIFNWFI